jgi:SAM-dependent methyltransferase
MKNIDPNTVSSFGDEWAHFDQKGLSDEEHAYLFETYFNIFPWDELATNAKGFDMGCGSGRWAALVAPRVGHLMCIDASADALLIARQKLSKFKNISYLNASVSDKTLDNNSQDFGYSLGVLHHVPNTELALKDCVKMLKPGAPFLLYLYYRFDNRPVWYALVWKASDLLRRLICKRRSWTKLIITNLIATLVYLPLARLAYLGEKFGFNVSSWLLNGYRNTSFYTMRTDARDRFGTPLEQRFTKREIEKMMHQAGLVDICFSDGFPFWCAVGRKA